jgi:hypothetical protein
MTPAEAEVAEWLESQLTQLAAKLEKLAHTRLAQHDALLGGEHSPNWQGSKRTAFESDYTQQQNAFKGLEAAARTLRGAVSDALAEARKNNN